MLALIIYHQREREIGRESILKIVFKRWDLGTCLVVQWLRLCTPSAGDPGLTSGQGTRSHMLQLRVHVLQLKDSSSRNKDPAQSNKLIFKIYLNGGIQELPLLSSG